MKNKVSGTYFIRKRKTGWYLWFQHFVNKVRTREPVDKKAFRDLGFKHEWTPEEAREHCSQLNKERSFLREKIRLSGKRVAEFKTLDEDKTSKALSREYILE